MEKNPSSGYCHIVSDTWCDWRGFDWVGVVGLICYSYVCAVRENNRQRRGTTVTIPGTGCIREDD